MPLSSPQRGSGSVYFSRFLDTAGDGTGTKNANADFSAAATDFLMTPGAAQLFQVHRIIVQITDIGKIKGSLYGKDTVLSKGIRLLLLEGSNIITDYMDGLPVLTNNDWSRFCFDVSTTNFGGKTEQNYITARWTFAQGGTPITVPFGQSLAARLHDDFSKLIAHTFCVQGLIRE